MHPGRAAGGWRRRAASGVVLAMALVAAGGLSAVWAPVATADGLCATPGGSGPGGTLTGVVNTYYPGVGVAPAGATSIDVGASAGSGTPIAAGDLLVVIQMQDAAIDSSNTDSYGHGPPPATPAAGYTSLNGSGQYEYVRATSAVGGGTVSITGLGPGAGLINTYTTAVATPSMGQRTFQVIRVPQYTTATTGSGLTALAWNGSVGGVLALDTTATLTLNGTVDLDGLGFRGAPGRQRGGAPGLTNTDVVTSAAAAANGLKAEGLAGTPAAIPGGDGYPGGDAARGAPGNAGGGGTDGRPSANDQNSGGGGGGNGGTGGQGGNTWQSNLPRGGYGGVALLADAGRVFLGGGGGAGTANNFPPPAAGGAAGGGIALVRAGSVAGAGSITANGADAYNLTQNDGAGGGGAGGTIVVTSTTGSLSAATLTADGGRGGNAWATQAGAAAAHGPGGGGGGGWVLTSSPPASVSVGGGLNGITTTGNLSYNAAPGADGQTATISPAAIPGVSGGAECADLSLTKSGPASVLAGGIVSYTLTVDNAGPAAADSVSVTDTLPAGVTFVAAAGPGWTCSNSGNASVSCTRPSLGVGASAPIVVTVTAPAQATTLTNAASVTATSPDPTPANNTDTVDTTVAASADLSLTKTGPAQVRPGRQLAYQLQVRNLGPSAASAVTVTDTLPAGVSFTSASGAGWSCSNAADVSVTCTRSALPAGVDAPQITVRVVAPVGAATLVNLADVGSATTDPDMSNNADTSTTSVGAAADLSLSKSAVARVPAGQLIAYTLVVRNVGPDAAADVLVHDRLPSRTVLVSASGAGWDCATAASDVVSCTRPQLASGVSAPVITVVVQAPTDESTVVNRASVGSGTFDPDEDNNAASVATAVTGGGDDGAVGPGPGGSFPQTGLSGLRSLLTLAVALLMLGVGLRLGTRTRHRLAGDA